MSPDPELPCPCAFVRFSRSSSPRSSSRPLPSPSNPPFPTKPFVKPISSASVTTVRSHTSSTNVPSASRRRSPGPTSRRSPFLTPFAQLVRFSESYAGNYSAQQADLHQTPHQHNSNISVYILFTPS